MNDETKLIAYGIGRNYLSEWTIEDALREIYQNYLDFGEFDEKIIDSNEITVNIRLSNAYKPEALEFLRIGNSAKREDNNTIGKHGEGLKMAMLILLREGFNICIKYNNRCIFPKFEHIPEIGDCLSLYSMAIKTDDTFAIEYSCPYLIYNRYNDNIIRDWDILFKDASNGRIVDKIAGNIYSGRLFVTNVKNLKRAYDIYPRNMNLDRDRQVPRTFDVNYHSSKLNEKYSKLEAKDLTYSDTLHIDSISEDTLETITPKAIGNNIAFTYKDKGKDVIISNESAITAITRSGYFSDLILNIKRYIASKLGLYDMLLEFKQKHVIGADAISDFDVILERVRNK